MRRREESIESCEAGTEALARAVSACPEKMPAEVRAAVRDRLTAAIAPEAVPLRVRLLRPAIALAAAGSMLGGVSYAAAVSAPGDLLYPVKRSVAAACATAYRGVGGGTTPKTTIVPAPAEAPTPAPVRGGSVVGKPAVGKAAKATPRPSAVTTPDPSVKGKSSGKLAKPQEGPNPKAAPKAKPRKKAPQGRSSKTRSGAHRPAAATKR